MRWLGIGVVLAIVGLWLPGATLAREEAPAITPFSTAHLVITGTITQQGKALPIQGEGDIDAGRGANHFTLGYAGAVFESITVDQRTYTRDTATGQWRYSDNQGNAGFNATRIAPYDPEIIRASGRNFKRLGSETLAGTATTHWRADTDLALLFGLGGGTTSSSVDSSPATMDLWIGDSDGRLHQLVLSSVEGQSATPTALGLGAINLTITFSNFDQPIAILAPPGAVPATPRIAFGATPAATASLSSGAVATTVRVTPTPSRLVEITGANGALSAAVVQRFIGVISLAGIGLATWAALRHRKQYQQRDDDEQQ